MAVEFTDLNDAEIRELVRLYSNRASQLHNGLLQIEADRARAEKPLTLMTKEQAGQMTAAIEAEVRASMALIMQQEISPAVARANVAAKQEA